MATPSHTSSTFPNDELMQADYTYTNQATYNNMGVYSGVVDADAEYEDETYQCTSGQYLAAGGTSCTACPTGRICPGGTFTYDTNNAQGIWKFSLTTTNTTTSFDFALTAVGTFTVDCGSGGTLTSSASPTDVSNGNTITRSGTTETIYTCTWGSADAHTILFDGTATNYDGTVNADGIYNPAISFFVGSNTIATVVNSAKIASISGNLSIMFPYKTGNAANGAQPRFYRTFYKATNLTSIPSTLFADYTSASTHMFSGTFSNCSALTSAGIPSNLFFPNATNGVSGASNMFRSTFSGCTGLTYIPENLFSKITSGATGMFYGTFRDCAGLTSLPSDLFSNITSGAESMFYYTFRDCTGLTSLPSDLFSKITSGARSMFQGTFYGCTGLTSLPSGLFFQNATNGVSGAEGMFRSTFNVCTGLTSLPSDLFSKITSGVTGMFYGTFNGCTGLTSLPSGLFFPNAQSVSGATEMFRSTFYSCTGLTSLPSDLFSKITSGATDMFRYTFANCTNLGCETAGCSTGTGYVSPTLFAGITPRGSNATNTMSDTFYNTKLVEICPAGTTQYTTGWESYWGDNKVSCAPNVISITWIDALQSDVEANDAGTMIYGGDIRTPRAAIDKPGMRFLGWRFEKITPSGD